MGRVASVVKSRNIKVRSQREWVGVTNLEVWKWEVRISHMKVAGTNGLHYRHGGMKNLLANMRDKGLKASILRDVPLPI